MAKLKDFPKEVLKLMEQKTMKIIKKSITSGDLQEPQIISMVKTEDKWVGELVKSIIEASDAVSVSTRLGFIDYDNLKVTFKLNMAVTGYASALLGIHFDRDEYATNLKTAFWGGETVETEVDGKTVESIIIDGKPGVRTEIIQEASILLVDFFKKHLAKDDVDVMELIKEIENKAAKAAKAAKKGAP